MNKKNVWLIAFLVLILAGIVCLFIYNNQNTTKDGFVVDKKCQDSLDDILKKSMGLMDDNTLPADLKCMDTYDFKKVGDARLMSNSSLLNTLFNLFQSKDSTGAPYIAKFFEFKNAEGVEFDWSKPLETAGKRYIPGEAGTTFNKVSQLLTNSIVPMIVTLRNKFKDISTSAALSGKYNMAINAANRQFINGFLAKYKDFSTTGSSGLYDDEGTEENLMFKAWTVGEYGMDPLAISRVLKDSISIFAISYLLKVNMTAKAQCNVDIVSTQVDNDIKKYVRFSKIFKLWRGLGKKGAVKWTEADLNSSSVFQSSDPDLTKQGIIDYFTKELSNASAKPAGMTDEAFAVQEMNKAINNEFVTDGGINDGRLKDDPGCLSGDPVTDLHCSLMIDKDKICDVNMEACNAVPEFNQYCTAVKNILVSTSDTKATMPEINLSSMPTSSAEDYLGRPTSTAAAGRTTTTAARTTAASTGAGNTTTTAASTGTGNTTTTAASTGLPGAGPGTVGSTLTSYAASDPLFTGRLTQYGIPSYFDRGTQDLLIFVYEKLSAAYNFDDEDVPDDIKQAISQLSPAGKASLCARYCQLTTRCNGICKLAGCLNCQVGTGSQAGSDATGSSASSLGYAGIEDDYNLLGFLDEISNGGNTTVSSGGSGASQDTYKHMGPMISQKDTSGVSNIFAPYIVMAPKKDGSTYGAYLLEDPNDPNYQAYINDLVKSF